MGFPPPFTDMSATIRFFYAFSKHDHIFYIADLFKDNKLEIKKNQGQLIVIIHSFHELDACF